MIMYSSVGTEPTCIVLNHYENRQEPHGSNLHSAGPAFYSETVLVNFRLLKTLPKLVHNTKPCNSGKLTGFQRIVLPNKVHRLIVVMFQLLACHPKDLYRRKPQS
jgi:hypothetical protein